MRDRTAPEVRGLRCRRRWPRLGLCGLLFLAIFPWHSGADGTELSAESSSRRLRPSPSVATTAFALPDLDGTTRRLQAHQDTVVLVHFFATWCEPCRAELASLSRLTEGPWGQRVSVVAVNVAEVPVRVRRFLDAAPVTFPVVLDADRAVTRAWDVSILPTTFVLDRDLRARLFVEGDVDWQRSDIAAALEAVDAGNRSHN